MIHIERQSGLRVIMSTKVAEKSLFGVSSGYGLAASELSVVQVGGDEGVELTVHP